MKRTIPSSIRSIFLILFLISFPLTLSGQFTVEGRWPYGPSYAVAANGDIAAFGNGAVIELIDLSQRAGPLPFAQIELTAAPRDIQIQEERLYVAIDEMGLLIYDISNPYAPVFVSSTKLNHYDHQMVVDENWVYLSDGMGYISIININDPFNPLVETQIDVHTKAWEMILHEDLLIATVFDSLVIIDVTKPFAPVKLTTQFIDYCSDVAVVGDKLFLVDFDSLLIFNFTDPGNPVREDSYTDYGRFVKIEAVGDYLFAGGTSGKFTIYKMLPENEFTMISQFKDDGFIMDMVVENNRVFFSNVHEGFLIFDIQDLTSPTLLLKKENQGFTYGMQVRGNTAYVANWMKGLQIVNIEDPQNINSVSRFETGYQAYDVVLDGQLLYLIEHGSDFRIFDISNPTAPVEITDVDLPGETWDIEINGDLLYAAQRKAGFYILNVSDPTNPVLIDSLPMDADLWNLDVKENFAYIANGQNGMRIVDVSDPNNPYEVGYYNDDTNPDIFVRDVKDVKVVGNRAYLADHNNGFHILDITDKSNPTQIVNYWTPGRAFAIEILDDQLFVGLQYRGIQAFNVKDPTNPILLATLETGGLVENIAVDNDFVYITDYDCGFSILSLQTTTGVQAIADPEQIKLEVFPNPIVESSKITFKLTQHDFIKLDLINLEGKRIMTLREGPMPPGKIEIGLNSTLGNLSSGVYAIRASIGDTQYVRLVVIP